MLRRIKAIMVVEQLFNKPVFFLTVFELSAKLLIIRYDKCIGFVCIYRELYRGRVSHSQNLDRSQTLRVSGFVNNDSYYKAITCAGEREGFWGKMRKNCNSWHREKGYLICLSDLTGYTGSV